MAGFVSSGLHRARKAGRHAHRHPTRGRMAVLAGGLVLTPATPARATQNPATFVISQAQALFDDVGSGDNLDVAFKKWSAGGAATTIRVEGPGGVTQSCTNPAAAPKDATCTMADLTSPQAGIWRINFGGGQNHSFTIDVQNGRTPIAGRVWSELLLINQVATDPAMKLWYRSQEGYLYGATYKNYNGVSSEISANATGVALKDTCVSAYESMDLGGAYGDTDRLWRPPAGRCGDPYKIFFEEPARCGPVGRVAGTDRRRRHPCLRRPRRRYRRHRLSQAGQLRLHPGRR